MLILTLGTKYFYPFWRPTLRPHIENCLDLRSALEYIFLSLTQLPRLQKNKQLICSFWDESNIYNPSNFFALGFQWTFVIKFLKKSIILRILSDASIFFQSDSVTFCASSFHSYWYLFTLGKVWLASLVKLFLPNKSFLKMI